MPAGAINTLIIGGGQAGLAMSGNLRKQGVSHLVVERDRIAESWRTRRWDSLVANGPAWHDRFPDLEFAGIDADGFAAKDAVVDYFETYARQIDAPIQSGVDVRRLSRQDGRFLIETSGETIVADRVVVATGPFQRPSIPAIVPRGVDIPQIHSHSYRNPDQLPPGAVLVVGAGSSGVQIADELLRAGRRVCLSVGPHNRPPRRYRGKDFCWWLGALGHWEARTPNPGTEHVTIAVSGARGGHTIDFRELAERGMVLLGRAEGCDDGGVMRFAADLAGSIAAGDADYLSVLDQADAYVTREGLDFPEEPEARAMRADPACLTDPILSLDLADVGSIVWATGYTFDFGWIDIDTFDAGGRPIHDAGVSAVPGLYFLGLPWLSRRASAFIWGVWGDAERLAGHIAAHTPAPAPAA
ncbi:NAD(P)/FAD-dependent oxidoreductase [Sphingomonas naphthae]|uniref:NAD(P)/FAD-dependent oxidoreductase n=1 Tax=Sphingomonas naphthae TaxID=1813468 RepID=A0ABY7TJH2_9SPHN|nr:NAD(P)/FAD-dependent oxidoreductase [Sphingomonas naphthae]WCT73073.1 NAD(P)/FAD-dependent oxidoreductase [Sphingomonas naphthae]